MIESDKNGLSTLHVQTSQNKLELVIMWVCS